MNYIQKEAQNKQVELWRKFNLWQERCTRRNASETDFSVRAKVLQEWKAATESLSQIKGNKE